MAIAHRTLVDRPVLAKSPTGKEIAASLRLHEWTDEERAARVWKRLGFWWLGAFAAAVVPPHFPWLFIGLLGGPIAAWLASRERATVQEQSIACPDCGVPAHIDEHAATWPLGARCEPCRRVFWISLAPPAGELVAASGEKRSPRVARAGLPA